eukprot:scaffold1254_cov376-Prasinococcus_capsulatus_cf.AAC.6
MAPAVRASGGAFGGGGEAVGKQPHPVTMRQSTSSIRAQGALSWRSLPLRLRSLMPDLVARCQVEWPSTEHAWCHKVLVHRIRYVCGPVCDRTLACTAPRMPY